MSDDKTATMEVEEVEDMEEEEDQGLPGDGGVFLPGRRQLEDNEELVMDESAYRVYFQLNVESSSLSFDVLRDNLGDDRGEVYPITSHLIAGTQAQHSHTNKLVVMKLSNLTAIKKKAKKESDAESSSSDEEDEEEETLDDNPEVESAVIRHNGVVNRVRARECHGRYLAASWSEMGHVYLWDLSRPLTALNDSAVMLEYTRLEESPDPIFTFKGHSSEGFALDWSPVLEGRLASGDCSNNIHIWNPTSHSWSVDKNPLTGHTGSVEDLQWSPTEPSVLCSCSVDRSLRLWDVRDKPQSACKITLDNCHSSDINVIAWNRLDTSTLLSGGDDGCLKVWDFRQVKRGGQTLPSHVYTHHKSPITSVEWHPKDRHMFAASGEDDQVTMWDVSLEQEGGSGDREDEGLPPHLLFIHMGQREIKELHWHPQIPGLLLSTALDGYNIFRTINV